MVTGGSERPQDLHKRFSRDPSTGGVINRAQQAGVATTLLVQSRSERKRITFINDGATIVYLAKGENAALNSGIRLNANGGSLVDECDAMGYMYVGPWSGISSVACNVCIVEEF